MLGSGNLQNTWTLTPLTSTHPEAPSLPPPSPGSDLGLFSLTRHFVTLVCPELSMKLSPGDMAGSRKRSLSASHSPPAAPPRDSESLGNSAETLLAEAGHSILDKLVKLREKIIANQHLNIKNRLVRKRKRTVSFADDKGMPLEDVRVVEEDNADTADTADTADSTDTAPGGEYSMTPWIMAFYQPIFDKHRMKKVFAEKGVALETVDVEDTHLSGTVKVHRSRSRSPGHRVFLRYTHDSWKTHCDVTASPVPVDQDLSRALTEAVYTFDIPIPSHALHLQFAVCAVTTTCACWDNNDGNNYILLHHSCLESDDSGSDSDSDNTKL